MSRLKQNTLKKNTKKEQQGDTLVEKFPLNLTPEEHDIARYLQRVSARVWNAVMVLHRLFWYKYHIWVNESQMKAFLKGKYDVHSQDVQAIIETYYECWERTKKLRDEGHTEWRYPWRKKRYFTATWKITGISLENGCLRLSNGWNVPALVIKLPKRLVNAKIKQVQLVWHRNQYWLHVTVEKPALKKVQGNVNAAVDPGEVHAATITDGKEALVISGRLLRSLRRLRNKTLRKFQKAISRTKKGSSRRRKLLAAKYQFLNNIERRIEHTTHTISAIIAKWCLDCNVKTVYIGNPEGVRRNNCGRKHNQRMSQWAFGKLRELLEYKLKRHGIKLIPVDERGTSGTCPACGEYSRQIGRTFKCGKCGFAGPHRDVVGASGILDKSVNGRFTKGRRLPEKVEYARPKVVTPKKAA